MHSDSKPAQSRTAPARRDRPTSKPASEHAQKLSVNPLKKRRRDLLRLLNRTDEALPADVRINCERELATCEYDIETAAHDRIKQQMIGKYHMVRFFERRKAERILKKLKRKLHQSPATPTPLEIPPVPAKTRETLEADIEAGQVDLNYTLFFPLNKVYVSLYAGHDKNKHADSVAAQRAGNAMWDVVRVASEQGRDALQALRDGAVDHSSSQAMAGGVRKERNRKAEKTSTKEKGGMTARAAHEARKDGPKRDESGSDAENGETFFE